MTHRGVRSAWEKLRRANRRGRKGDSALGHRKRSGFLRQEHEVSWYPSYDTDIELSGTVRGPSRLATTLGYAAPAGALLGLLPGSARRRAALAVGGVAVPAAVALLSRGREYSGYEGASRDEVRDIASMLRLAKERDGARTAAGFDARHGYTPIGASVRAR